MEDTHDIEALRRNFRYRPETGFIYERRVSRWFGRPYRRRAGWANGNGYRRVTFQGVKYREHRLAFALMTGRWPKEAIDHKNCLRDDNRWENIREATTLQNNVNGRRMSRYLKGTILRPNGKWESRLQAHGRYHFLGYFATEKEAHEAYTKAAREQHGEFARTQSFWFD